MTRMRDIIVPHYREPWEDGRKFFDLMEHQRGIRHDDFRVTVVQDGLRRRFRNGWNGSGSNNCTGRCVTDEDLQ